MCPVRPKGRFSIMGYSLPVHAGARGCPLGHAVFPAPPREEAPWSVGAMMVVTLAPPRSTVLTVLSHQVR